eukprot:1148875-Pelagomonas_calceolata.AAC.4
MSQTGDALSTQSCTTDACTACVIGLRRSRKLSACHPVPSQADMECGMLVPGAYQNTQARVG